ncbi:MAG: hypothetical protein EAZ16_13435 [Sphingobacteriales bacterium]|nr:MAG: hypothetical protein EAZ16_13435 [Sphingobacteriales bacterium]
MKFICLCLLACINCWGATAQKKVSKFNFQSINEVGFTAGENATRMQFSTSNGIGNKNWYAGLATGMDFYRFRTVPVYTDFRYRFLKGPGQVFAYINTGYHFAWATTNEKVNIWQGSSTVQGGVHFAAGGGYQFNLKNKHAILISAGYSYKRATEKVNLTICGFAGCNPSPVVEEYKYRLRRLSLKVGWLLQ